MSQWFGGILWRISSIPHCIQSNNVSPTSAAQNHMLERAVTHQSAHLKTPSTAFHKVCILQFWFHSIQSSTIELICACKTTCLTTEQIAPANLAVSSRLHSWRFGRRVDDFYVVPLNYLHIWPCRHIEESSIMCLGCESAHASGRSYSAPIVAPHSGQRPSKPAGADR